MVEQEQQRTVARILEIIGEARERRPTSVHDPDAFTDPLARVRMIGVIIERLRQQGVSEATTALLYGAGYEVLHAMNDGCLRRLARWVDEHHSISATVLRFPSR